KLTKPPSSCNFPLVVAEHHEMGGLGNIPHRISNVAINLIICRRGQMKFSSRRILALSLVMALLTGAALEKSPSIAGASRDDEINRAAESLRAKLIEQRRYFHMHPELSNSEERTSRVIAEKLRALGLDEVKTGVGKYGVVALLKGGMPGGVVAVRADMD